jgi:ACS family glucarate transporter-like MFS transporter
MLGFWNWRLAFLLLGLSGLIWTAGWLIWFKDSPPKHAMQAVEEERSQENASVPGTLLSASLGLAMLQYFASNFTNFICLSWMLPYLRTRYHVSIYHAAAYSMAPLLLGATAQGVAGSMVDRIYNSRLRPWSRRLPAMVGFTLAIIGLTAVIEARFIGSAVIAFSVAIFGTDMTVSPSWVFCTDLNATRTGRVSGTMNMCGSLGAFLQHKTGNSSAYFSLAAVLDVAGVLCWLGMRSVGPIFGASASHLPEVS